MTEEIKAYFKSCLSSAGFVPIEEYNSVSYDNVYPAFFRISGIELDELKYADMRSFSARITVQAELLGSQKGFYGQKKLTLRAEQLAEQLYLNSQFIIKKISLGAPHKNMTLGRLEIPFEVTFVTELERGES